MRIEDKDRAKSTWMEATKKDIKAVNLGDDP